MDSSEFPYIILSRVQKLEPENFFKIVGCIFLMGHGEQEMIQLAFSPDNVLLSKINEAKSFLSFLSPKSALISAQVQSPPRQLNPFTRSPPNFHVPMPFLEAQLVSGHRPFNDSFEDYAFHHQPHFLGMEEPMDPSNSFYCHEGTMGGGLHPRVSRRTVSLPEILKPCIYHYKGNCKHGASCRFFHGQLMHGDYDHMFNPNMNESNNEDDGFLPGSLDKLEMEIAEILKSRGGSPISIASLPMLYSEKYGRSLQAEGYLTESQRHGKTGYSLTKLLTRLKNSIQVIDRPHGQHSVILAKDASRFMECRSESEAAASSHQIYLTFPADSKFEEPDVGKYFEKFGKVEDVRIPCQDKRMFGFVSFTNSETVKAILSRRNPHYICGARVLVKPYKEKSKMFDRTYMEKMRPSMYHHPSHYFEMDPEIHSVYSIPREFDGSRIVRKCQMDENQRMMELERMGPSDFNLGPKPLNQQPYLNYCVEEVRTPGLDEFPLVDHFSYTLDALNIGSTSDDKTRNTSDQESVHVDLPESPFASPQIPDSVSTVI